MSAIAPIPALLLPELEREFAITRRALAAIPEAGLPDFRPHAKSMRFENLAGHVAEMPAFVSICLTAPPVDLAAPGAPSATLFESKAQILAVFDELAAKAVADLTATTEASLSEPWKLNFGPTIIFEGDRYNAYRTLAINHMVHHRAQLGVYLRLNGEKVPATYGPSADEA